MTAEPTCARCGERKGAGVHDTPEVCEETRGPCLDPVRHHPYSVTAEPTTEAGRSLLRYASALDDRLNIEFGIPKSLWLIVDESVARIEAEARADVRRRIAEAVRGLERGEAQARIGVMYADIEVVDLADVLAIIERQPVSQADLTDRVASA